MTRCSGPAAGPSSAARATQFLAQVEGSNEAVSNETGVCGACTWEVSDDGVLTIRPTNGTEGTLADVEVGYGWPWDKNENITSVVISSENGTVKTAENGNARYLFYGLTRCEAMDLSGLDTSSATTMRSMFCSCSSLTSITFGKSFDTSKVTDMENMFYGCSGLTSLDLSSFDTSSVKNMSAMLYNCSGLTSLDLPGSFDTSSVTDMSYMCSGCSALTTILATPGEFAQGKVSTSRGMFAGCEKLVGGSGTTWSSDNITGTYAWVDGYNDLPGCFRSMVYTVNFDKNADDATGTMDGQEFTYGTAQELTENAFARDGYMFAGWNTKADGTGTDYADKYSTKDGEFTMTEGGTATTLYAVWKESYTVTFHANDGTNATASQDVLVGAETALDKNAFSLDGYTFKGWAESAEAAAAGAVSYADGQKVTDLAEQGGTKDLYAVWSRKVTYHANGGEGADATQTFYYDGSQALLGADAFSRKGYALAGWASSATGDKLYDAGVSKTISELVKAGATDLYAVWKANPYTVSFDKNAEDATGEMADQDFTYDQVQNLTANAFKRTGYTLLGWSTDPGAAAPEYADGYSTAAGDLTATDGGEVTLYAVWAANSYIVAFDPNADDATGEMAD